MMVRMAVDEPAWLSRNINCTRIVSRRSPGSEWMSFTLLLCDGDISDTKSICLMKSSLSDCDAKCQVAHAVNAEDDCGKALWNQSPKVGHLKVTHGVVAREPWKKSHQRAVATLRPAAYR